MKKLTKQSLDELAKVMPVLSEEVQSSLVGGGSGTESDPYTTHEYEIRCLSGIRFGAYVRDYDNQIKYMIFTGKEEETDSSKNNISFQEIANRFFYNSMYGSGFSDYFGTSGYIPDDIDIYEWFYGNPSESSGGGGSFVSSSSGMLEVDKRKHDGVDLSNSRNFSFDSSFDLGQNSKFKKQLTEILESNAVLRNLLSYANKSAISLTFEVNELNLRRLAHTGQISKDSYRISFNSKYITTKGWNNTYTGGYDNVKVFFSPFYSMEEKLVLTLAHEVIHFNHMVIYNEALKRGGNDLSKAVKWLRGNNYNQEFINIFFKKDKNGSWCYTSQDSWDKSMHNYIIKYEKEKILDALTEYQKDYNLEVDDKNY